MVEAFRGLGHTVEVVALVSPPSSAGDGGISSGRGGCLPCRIPFFREILLLGYNLVGLAMLCRAIRRFRPDFIYERYSLLNFAGVLASKLFRIPLVLEVNAPLALEESQEKLIRLHRLARWSEAFICNAATRVVAVSGVLASILAENGVSPARITVLHNGISPGRFRPGPPSPELRTSLGLEDAFVFGFVGWFRPWHGLELLLESYALSGLASSNARLLLVGDGPALPAIRDAASRLGVSASVIFTGPVPHDAVPGYIRLFDCAVQPAANPYCCPMKIVEYLAMGKPVIAPRQDNICEIVSDRVEGLLFEPGDPSSLASALLAVYENRTLLSSLADAAAAAVARKKLLWSANAETVVSWFVPDSPGRLLS